MSRAQDSGLSTRLTLMLEIHTTDHTKLKTLAPRLGITIQATSELLRRLSDEGLVQNEGRAWKPTPKGTQWLHDNVHQLKRFVDGALASLSIIEQCTALADRSIEHGERVLLFMRDGHLWARPGRDGASTGTARNDTPAGGLVAVDGLTGMVELQAASITVIAHAEDGRAGAEARRLLTDLKGGLLAVHDTSSRAVANAFGRQPSIEFAAVEATIEAVRRGVPVAYLVPRNQAPGALAAFRKAKDANGEPIPVRSVGL